MLFAWEQGAPADRRLQTGGLTFAPGMHAWGLKLLYAMRRFSSLPPWWPSIFPHLAFALALLR